MKKLIAIFFLFTNCVSYSQQSQGGTPITFSNEYFNLFLNNDGIQSTIPVFSTPVINDAVESQIADSTNIVGEVFSADIDIKLNASLRYLSDSSKLYLMKVVSTSSSRMMFYFDKLYLASESRLFLYNSDKTMIIGSFNQLNNRPDSSFMTQSIMGDTIFIEYYEPYATSNPTRIHLSRIGHFFSLSNNLSNRNANSSNSVNSSLGCEIDVSCPLGTGWSNEASSVVQIDIMGPVLVQQGTGQTGFLYNGSGAIINNTKQDGRPLLLTANHLATTVFGVFDQSTNSTTNPIINNADAQSTLDNWIFYFNYYNTSCGSTPYNNSGQALLGSTLVARDENNSGSDYMLIDLTKAFLPTQNPSNVFNIWGVCYSGWDVDPHGYLPFTCIHHPEGDYKKISVSNNPISSTSTASLLKIFWDTDPNGLSSSSVLHGTVEHGSSGAPLYFTTNGNPPQNRIIGQLYGRLGGSNADDCSKANADSYPSAFGSLKYSWDNDVNFSAALAPDGASATAMNTFCPPVGGVIGWVNPANPTQPTNTTPPNNTPQTNYVLPEDYLDLNGIVSGNKVGQHSVTLCPNDNPVIYLNDQVLHSGGYWQNYLGQSDPRVPCSAPHLGYPYPNCSTLDEWLGCHCHALYESYYLSVLYGCDDNYNNCFGEIGGDWHTHEIYTNVQLPLWQTIDVSSVTGVQFQPGNHYRIIFAIDNDLTWVGSLGWHAGVVNLNMAAYDLDLSNKTLQTSDYAAASHILMANTIINSPYDVSTEAGIEIHIQDGTVITGNYHGFIDNSLPCFSGSRQADTNTKKPLYPSPLHFNQVLTPQIDSFIAPPISKKNLSNNFYSSKKSYLFPNPTNSDVSINYTVIDSDNISIDIYSSLGVRLVSLIDNKAHLKGQYNITYNTNLLQEGAYLVEIKSNIGIEVLKLNVIK